MIDSKTERERNEVSPYVDKFQVIDLTGSTSNDMRSVSYRNGYSGHDIEKVRRTIIEHESIFRHQLQDLHRLYGRQRELMSEIKKYVSKDKCIPIVPPPQDTRSLRAFEPRFFTSGILPKATDHKDGFLSDNNQVSCDGDTKLSLSVVRTSHQRISDAFYPNPKDRISDDLTLSRGMKDFFQNSLDGKSYPSILGSRNETSGKETRKESSHCPYTDTKVSWKKRKIFGVEISGDEYTFGTASNSSTPGQSNHHIVSINNPSPWVSSSCMKKNHDLKPIEFQSNHKHPQNGLPWFLKNLRVSSDSSKTEKKSSYFMNLDSLQNHSENFFRKAEGKSQDLEQKKEIAIEDDSVRKVEMNETNQVEGKDNLVLHEGTNNECTPNLSWPRIDLNMSLDDDEPPSPVEPEASYEECDKIAANAIIDISSSSSTKRSLRGEGSYDLLKWLADIISDEVEEAVPDGMDDFEFTTLRLEDMKEEHHYQENVVFKTPTSDTTLAMKRSRRGRQHRRDFQRDILPGLVTLSRLEVTEDFQTFQELMKAKWGPARNGRGRKRLERSLTGWGRRRKRCGNAVKC